MTLIFCCSQKQGKQFREKLSRYTVNIIESTCEQMDENLPVVVRIPEGTFFARVTPERIVDVYAGNADDLKIQTARLYDVDMEKYMSEPVYRQIVKAFATEIDQADKWDVHHISQLLKQFYASQTLSSEFVNNAIKIALLKTTRCPALPDLLAAFSKQEVEKRLENFSVNYRNRI